MKKLSVLLVVIFVSLLSACNDTDAVFDIVGTEEKVLYVGTSLPDFMDGVDSIGIEPEGKELLKCDTSNVDMEHVGTYEVLYYIELDGEKLYEESVQVIVTDGPIDEHPLIKGVKDFEYIIGEDLPDFYEGVTVEDSKYGNVTATLEVDVTEVNFDEVGTYEVFYVAENEDGYFAYESSLVTVKYGDDLTQLPTEFLMIRVGDKVGIKSLTGETIIEPIYAEIMYIGDEMLVLSKEMSTRSEDITVEDILYYNLETNTYFTSEYEPIGYYSDGLIPVREVRDDSEQGQYNYMYMGKCGYMDKNGEIVIPLIYSRTYMFKDGMAKVAMGHDNYGYIDTDGEEILPVMYNDVYFTNDHFITRLADLHQVFDKDLNVVLSGTNIDFYSEGNDEYEYYRYTVDGKYGFANTDFETIIQPKYQTLNITDEFIVGLNKETALYDFYKHDGTLLKSGIQRYIMNDNEVIVKINDKYGVVTSDTFETVITAKYVAVSEYVEGYYQVTDSLGRLGVVSITNELVIPMLHSEIGLPNENSVVIVRVHGGGYSVYDLSGNKLTDTEYYAISPFVDGYADVLSYNLDHGLINQAGEEKISTSFYQIIRKDNGYFYTRSNSSSSTPNWGVLSPTFEQVLPNQYYSIGDVSDGLIPVKANLNDSTSSGYMNLSGEVVVPLQYRNTYTLVGGIGRVEVNTNQFRAINPQGEFINEDTYQTMSIPFEEGYVHVSNSSTTHGVIDSNGNVVGELIYKNVYVLSNGHFTVYDRNNNYNYMNLQGELVINSTDELVLISAFGPDFGAVKTFDGYYRAYDKDGNLILQNKDYIDPVTSDYLIVREITDKYGVYDKDGVVIESVYFFLDRLNDGYVLACENDYSTCGVIDLEGNEIIPLENELISHSEGQFTFRKNGQAFNVVIDEEVYYSFEGSLHTYLGVYDGTEWKIYVDDNSTPIITGAFDSFRYYEQEKLLLHINDEYRLIDSEGTVLFHSPYESFSYYEEDQFVSAYFKGNEGIYTKDGVEIIPPIYDNVMTEEYFDEYHVFIVENGDMYGCYDLEGNMILEVAYDNIMYINKNYDMESYLK